MRTSLRRIRRGTGRRLTARFRWAAVLLLLPLLGLAAVSGAGLVVSANASAALDHAQQLNGALANLDEDVHYFGLTALNVLIEHQADDLRAMTAAEQQVDADFSGLVRATGFTPAQEKALPLVADAWSATISNRDAIRRLGNSIQMNAAAASVLEDTISVDERSLTNSVVAVEDLGTAHVAGLRQERDGALFASALAVGVALVIGIAIAIWSSTRLARSVLRPLGILRTATSRLAAGDRTFRVGSGSGDEIAELGDAFDTMAAQLEQEQDAVRARERRLLALVENANDGIVVISAAGTIEFATPSFHEYVDPKGGVGLNDIVHPDDLERVTAVWLEGLSLSDGSTLEVKTRLKHRDGSWHHVWAKVTNRLADAGVAGMVINITDVSERHGYEEQLAFQAQHDTLTGLANRGLFRERLERVGASVGEARVSSVLYIDLDDFKRINDTLGHEAGDDLLLAIGERLLASVRPEDLVARLGSDEFAVLLESADAHMAVAATKRILGALQRPLTLGGRDVLPRASVGIASTTPAGPGAESLLGDADLAMYFAKRSGKAQYRVFSPEMRSDLIDRLQLGEDLRAAINSGSIEVNYQPIIDMRSGLIVGAETLARWHHPTRGWVGPAVFIALAEELDLVERIDAVVLRQACAQGRAWMDAGLPGLRLAVNLSGMNLNNPDLVANVAATLAASGFPAANLELELTEGVVIAESGGALATLDGTQGARPAPRHR